MPKYSAALSKLTIEDLKRVTCTEIERFIGLDAYSTRGDGVGGVIKEAPEFFRVWEVLEGGIEARYPDHPVKEPILPWALYVLYKRDRELIRALSEFADKVGVRASNVAIGGVKDRRAETWQFVAIPTSEYLKNRLDYVELYSGWARHIGYIDRLSSSKIVMNRFEVNVKRIKRVGEEVAMRLIEEMRERLVPNFYGHQRFGVMRPISHLVGSLLVKGELEEAVRAFIGGYTYLEDERIRELRRTFLETNDYRFVVENFPKKLRYERALARHVLEKGGDFQNAFRRLPLRLRRLLVESYSSYVFNKAISLSIKDGLELSEPRVGDMVCMLDTYGYPTSRVIDVNEWNIEEVARRIRSGLMAIVLPSPGYRVRLPKGPRGEIVRHLIDEEGVDLRRFRLFGMREAGTTGSYRPISITRYEVKSMLHADSEGLDLEISLVRGSYATSLLRELMKSKCALAYAGSFHEH